MKFTFRAIPMGEIAAFALETLQQLSPVGDPREDPHPGLYKASHLIFLNGASVADASAWRPGDVVHLSNPVPYSRKIEAGEMKMRVPGTDHVYQQAQQIVANQRGNQVSVRFIYMPVRFGEIADWAKFTKLERAGRRDHPVARQEWLTRQPALEITAHA